MDGSRGYHAKWNKLGGERPWGVLISLNSTPRAGLLLSPMWSSSTFCLCFGWFLYLLSSHFPPWELACVQASLAQWPATFPLNPCQLSPTNISWQKLHQLSQMQNPRFSRTEGIFKNHWTSSFYLFFSSINKYDRWFSPARHIIGHSTYKKESLKLYMLNGLVVTRNDIIIRLTLKLQTLALFKPHITNFLWLILYLIPTTAWLYLQHPWTSVWIFLMVLISLSDKAIIQLMDSSKYWTILS